MPLFFKCLGYVQYLSMIGIPSCFACCARDGARLSAAIFRLALSDNVPASKVRSGHVIRGTLKLPPGFFLKLLVFMAGLSES